MTTTSTPTLVDLARMHAGQLIEQQSWTRERLLEFRRVRLRMLLDHAVTASPYYRSVLGPDAARLDVRLEDLPTLSKSTLMARFDEIVTDPRLRLADVEASLSAPGAPAPLPGGLRPFTTGGSTGERGVFVYTPEELSWWIGAAFAGLVTWGVRPGTRLAGIGAPNDRHITRQIFAVLQGGGSAGPRLTAATSLPEIVASLNTFQPEVLVSYNSLLGLIAEEQLAGSLRIAPQAVVGTSEVLTEDTVQRLQAAWGITPVNVYATTEAPGMAMSHPAAPGLHIREDLLIMEVVDERNQPVPAGTPGQRVLLTNLVNHTQPLIRYEVTDTITMAECTDYPGTPFARIANVGGRSDDILSMPGRDGGQVAVHPFRLRAPFARLLDVRQFQIESDGAGLHVAVVLRGSAPADLPSRVRSALAGELAAAGAVPPPISVTPVATIEREGGQAAKFKLIKCR